MKKLLFILIITTSILACKEEQISEQITPGSNEDINNWIYDNMEFYYYWSEELPSKNSSSDAPEDYFYSLLSSKDRFSWIQPNFDELLNSLRGVNKEAGYEFILYNDAENANNVIGQISYVKKNSPASMLDIRRGDTFKKINNNAITLDNYRSLLNELDENHTLAIERYNFDTDQIDNLGDINFTTAVVAENPILLDTVYTNGNERIAYLVYNIFSVGAESGSQEYLSEMDAVINSFKTQNINHLILDLRYNSGGAETATINLASLLGANVSKNNIFIKRKYSPAFENALINEYGAEILNKYFVDKTENIGNQLINNQLIVLTSARTASASELLINGLKPYMNVLLIGDQTVGKNVGSTTIYNEDDPLNNYGMQPIITKSFNSNNASDYELGFPPDLLLKDNSLKKRPLGDIREVMLATAIDFIITPTQQRSSKGDLQSDQRTIVVSSKELKRNYGVYDVKID